ncbi:hypothetical protein HYZ76_02225 [Candidatus Falkowbacteria bacterium]|nr:hypothetical protein [Candidatus Falkowbacteria bacterium]
MFLTVHSTVGVIIGQTTGNIWLAFLIGFVSHFLLDIIPHGDENLIEEKNKFKPSETSTIIKLGIADGTVMIFFLLALYLGGLITTPLAVLFAVFGTILPDFIQGIYILTKTPLLEKYFSIHYDLHRILGVSVSLKKGLVIQTFFLVISLILLFNL